MFLSKFPVILGTLFVCILPVLSMASYVFTAFTSKSESNLYVYTSSDATNFKLLKGPAYKPPGTLIRDPSIHLHTDGLYYIAYTTGWSGNNFGVAKSSNLKDWTFHTTVEIAGVARTWAPEFFQDPATGKLHIVVSLGPDKSHFTGNLFTADDSSLKKWSGPVEIHGIGPNYIDTFLVYKAGQYHAFTKNEDKKFVEHAVADSVEGPYKFVQQGNFASWGKAEGPCITTLPDGKYRLYADGYDSGKYIYSDSDDLFQWSAYKTLPDGLSGFARHGTVLRIAD